VHDAPALLFLYAFDQGGVHRKACPELIEGTQSVQRKPIVLPQSRGDAENFLAAKHANNAKL